MQKYILLLFLLCLSIPASLQGATPKTREPDYAAGMELLKKNTGYISANRRLLEDIDKRLAASTGLTNDHNSLLQKHFEVMQRIISLEQYSRTLIREFQLFDNPYVHVKDANKDYRLRMPGTELTKLRKLAHQSKTTISELVLAALNEKYWSISKDVHEKNLGELVELFMKKLASCEKKDLDDQKLLEKLLTGMLPLEQKIINSLVSLQVAFVHYGFEDAQMEPLRVWYLLPRGLSLTHADEVLEAITMLTDTATTAIANASEDCGDDSDSKEPHLLWPRGFYSE